MDKYVFEPGDILQVEFCRDHREYLAVLQVGPQSYQLQLLGLVLWDWERKGVRPLGFTDLHSLSNYVYKMYSRFKPPKLLVNPLMPCCGSFIDSDGTGFCAIHKHLRWLP